MSPRKCLDVGSDEVRLAEVVERLGGRVDLVVVFCARKADELKDVLVEPGGVARQDHTAAFEPVAAGVQAHDLVGARWRFVLDDLPDAVVLKVLDELGARAFASITILSASNVSAWETIARLRSG